MVDALGGRSPPCLFYALLGHEAVRAEVEPSRQARGNECATAASVHTRLCDISEVLLNVACHAHMIHHQAARALEADAGPGRRRGRGTG